MKKILLALTIVVISFAAKAQLPKFGIKAGLNVPNLSITGASTSSKIGFHAGVFAEIPVSSFSINPEVLYSLEGAKETGGTSKFNLNMLNIPVMFQYNSPIGIYGETGPQFGFIMSANEEDNGQKVDLKDQLNSMNFSWAIGAGYKLEDAGLGFGVRYAIGISNLAKDASGGGSIKASNFQVSIAKTF